MSPTVLRQAKPKIPDLSDIAKASRSFFTQHKLDLLAKAIPTKPKLAKGAEEALAKAGRIGMEPTLILPPVRLQQEHLAIIARGMAASPCDAVPAELQYAEPYITEMESLKATAARLRPEGAYLLCMAFGAFEPETTNLSVKQLDKLFDADGVTGLTAAEFLLVQRLRVVENGDHRFADHAPLDDEPAGCQWLLDTRTKECAATAFWNSGKRRIEMSWAKFDAKHARRGAHRTMIIECV